MKTVLLVEDNPDVLEITAYMLEDAGYEVVAANSCEQAMQVASVRADIGVILTDLNLNAGMSGIEMAEAMHKDGLKCPLVVMSGDANPPANGFQSWMRYLPKPFDRQMLLKAITGYA